MSVLERTSVEAAVAAVVVDGDDDDDEATSVELMGRSLSWTTRQQIRREVWRSRQWCSSREYDRGTVDVEVAADAADAAGDSWRSLDQGEFGVVDVHP